MGNIVGLFLETAHKKWRASSGHTILKVILWWESWERHPTMGAGGGQQPQGNSPLTGAKGWCVPGGLQQVLRKTHFTSDLESLEARERKILTRA